MTSTPPNILLLTHRVPYPPDRGDRIRSYHLLRYLADRARVYLGALTDEPLTGGARIALDELTTEAALVPLGRRSRWLRAAWSLAAGNSATEGLFASPALNRAVRNWAGEVRFDAVIAFCSSMVQFTSVPELQGVPLIVDLVDVDSQKWFDYAASSRGWKRALFQWEGGRVRRLERSLASRATAITFVSRPEAALYRSFCPNDKTLAVSNGVDLDYFTDQFPVSKPKSNQCVFVGVLDYRANVEGLTWFCREVWPQVIAAKPDAVFAIVGKNPAPAIQKLAAQPGVRLVGPVPDVRPFIAESCFSIAPLHVARGIQNKVLEAMSMAKPVIATPQALEGLDVTPGIEVLAATSPAQWLHAMSRLYNLPELRRRLGTAGREFATSQLSWKACLQALDRLIPGIRPICRIEESLAPGVLAEQALSTL